MNPVVILGSTGMIGSTLVKYFGELKIPYIEVNREGIGIAPGSKAIQFDAANGDIQELISNFPQDTTFINLIGVIRHKIDLNNQESIQNAKAVNSIFPKELAKKAEEIHGRVIQIATDCIYSGKVGKYVEHSSADPVDVYGKTKFDGEYKANNLLTLRVSVIGREIRNHIELMDWVIYQSPQAELNGFENHFWNGITSLHFAKLVGSLITQIPFSPGTFHIVPGNSVSKFELVSLIARLANRNDLVVLETQDTSAVNRTLSTEFPDFNSMLWQLAGYEVPPTIEAMAEEYFGWLSQQN
jgi:dTDP-4-dehydrorhamnose reductase